MRTKTIHVLVFTVLLFSGVLKTHAETLLYNFEDGITQAGTTNMAWPWASPDAPYLRAFGVIDNPSVATPNSTSKVFHILEEKNPNWWDNLLRFTLTTPITITSANRYLHIMHRRPRLDGGGLVVNLNVNNMIEDNALKNKTRFDVNLSAINEWQDIVIDLNDLITNSVQLSQFNINPDVNNWTNSGLPLGDYFFDEIILSNNPLPRPYLTGNNLYDFETATAGNITGSIDNGTDANNTLSYPFANPFVNAKNTSANVGKRVAASSGANWWGGFFCRFSMPVQVDATHKYLHVLVSVPVAGQVILGEVMQGENNVNPDIVRTISYANTWQDVVFDLSSLAYFTGVRMDLGYWGGTAAGVYYCDDIYIDDNPNPRTNTVSISSGNTLSSSFGNCTDCDITVTNNAQLTIDQTQTIKSITVAPGAKLTLNTGNTFTATNGITLQSDATGTATFVDNGTANITTATVEQYLPQGRNWYVSSPITTGTNLNLSTGTSVVSYNEATGNWDTELGALTAGKGYISVSSSGSGTSNVSFSGTLNTGAVSVALTRKGSTKTGFNLVGNPYPSYLNVMDAINANANLEHTIWYRTKGASYTFETVNTTSGVGTNTAGTGTVTGYIPPMQAFWVRTNADNQTLTFTNAMRCHANPVVGETTVSTTPMKVRTQVAQQELRLQVSNGTNSDETVLYVNPNASDSYDAYDSPKMSNANASIPEIYTTAGSEQLVINGLNGISPNLEIPLGFNTGQANTFSLKATEIKNFDATTRVFLKDKVMNAEHELTPENPYSFNSDITNTTNRFSLIFRVNRGLTNLIDTKEPEISIYTLSNRQIGVNLSSDFHNEKLVVSIRNLMGEELFTTQLKTNLTTIPYLFDAPGIYLVSVSYHDKTLTKKVVLQ